MSNFMLFRNAVSHVLAPVMRFVGLIVALYLAVPALAATTQPTITGLHRIFATAAPSEQLRAVSSFTCGSIFSYKCTNSWTLTYVSVDPALSSFTATWDPSGINLKAELGFSVATSRTWESEVPNLVAQPTRNSPGPIRFAGINGLPNTAAATDYWSHPKQSSPTTPRGYVDDLKDLLNGIGESIGFDNKVVENPTLAIFNSSVTLVQPGLYEYTYLVTNMTAQSISFDWSDADRSGSVDPNGVVAWSIESPDSPYAVYGDLSADVLGANYSGPSTTVLPAGAALVPLPASVLLFSSSIALLGFMTRWRKRQKGMQN